MIFNNIDFGNYIKVEKVRTTILPPITNKTKEIPGKIGVLYNKNSLGPRYIEVEIRIIEKNKKKVRGKIGVLASLLYTKEPKELRFKEEPNKYYKAILDGSTDLDRFLYTGFSILTFIALDPIAYGETKTIDISSNTTIINQGSYKTTGRITIEVTQSIGHIQVTQQNTGEYVYIEHDFVAGDEVIIDLDREYVTKNGYSIMKDVYLESDFFDIPVGEFELTSSVPATLEYVERWL